jgi:hypothetical protein
MLKRFSIGLPILAAMLVSATPAVYAQAARAPLAPDNEGAAAAAVAAEPAEGMGVPDQQALQRRMTRFDWSSGRH